MKLNKKVYIVAVMFTFIPLLMFSQNHSGEQIGKELKIIGKVNNVVNAGEYMYIIYSDVADGFDSMKIVDGKYTFIKNIATTTLLTIYARNPLNIDNLKERDMLTILTEPTTIKVLHNDSLSNAKISGSEANIESNKLKIQTQKFYKKLTPLYKNYAAKESGDDKDSLAFYQQQIDSEKRALAKYYYEYLMSHPASLIRLDLIESYIGLSTENTTQEYFNIIETQYNQLSATDRNSLQGKRIARKLASHKFQVGLAAPEFTQNDTLGNPVSLSSLRGKYVLIDFWASWCSPCRRENENLVKLYDRFSNKGFTILSISLDKPEDKSKWIAAIKKDGLKWTQVSDLQYWDNQAAKLYKVSELPQNFLIDPKGIVIDKNLFGNSLDKRLQDLLL